MGASSHHSKKSKCATITTIESIKCLKKRDSTHTDEVAKKWYVSALKELVVSWSITNSSGGDCARRSTHDCGGGGAAAAGKDYLSPLPALVPWGKLLGRRKGAFGKLNSG